MDVVVIGAGPAGLQAGLTLGRMHRDVLVLDSGRYRNAPAEHMHNFATHDGRPPSEFRALARADLTAYDTVEVRDLAATQVRRRAGGGFETTLADGTLVESAAVLLATGVRDVLPDLPGLAEAFGRVAHHCPFCHGHELAGRSVAVQDGPRAAHLVPMLRRITHDVRVVSDPIDKIVVDGDDAVLTVAGQEVRVGGIFVASALEQAAPFAAQLGLDLLDSGCIAVDAMGRTSEPGVFAAGDLAHHRDLPMPLASVLNAAAAGQVAAGACVADLLAAEAGH
ncbi:NAD(P)/FAD-dependent oxidoreductase [Nocardioides gansuensis]|uniref:NAD(P)/FAD-dependent oxidoreductase n=1 Tax=Nocardioides gansuensis TaxID=2138300 RepID=A0A2T8FCK3_9ACTN|nr:NAD(P)/FAD-dependent oxidoreductase [Nocardioides gansuensis]PVG83433.1 NAD(P)/FAD-dependent oxidoreductase [Nocardioides gansuensis]